MFKKVRVVPYTYCNNPEIYLRSKDENTAYGKVLREMSPEVLNDHLNELNGIAQENYQSGYYHGFRNGVIAGVALTSSIVSISLGACLAIKDIKSKKQK